MQMILVVISFLIYVATLSQKGLAGKTRPVKACVCGRLSSLVYMLGNLSKRSGF